LSTATKLELAAVRLEMLAPESVSEAYGAFDSAMTRLVICKLLGRQGEGSLLDLEAEMRKALTFAIRAMHPDLAPLTPAHRPSESQD
jgi:hypothetical protein